MGSDPVTAFLTEKRAGFFNSVKQEAGAQFTGPALASSVVSRAGGAALGALGAGAVVGVGVAASKLYDAATKGRDFRTMLAHDPTLVPEHDKDPRLFNQFYSTLRTFNPDFARDPVVAAGYMHKMIDSPGNAGGMVVDSLSFRDKVKSPFEPVMRAAIGGATGENKHKGERNPPPTPPAEPRHPDYGQNIEGF